MKYRRRAAKRTLNIATYLFCMLFLCNTRALGEEVDVDQQILTSVECGRQLLSFCQRASLYSRGLASWPFDGSSNTWVRAQIDCNGQLVELLKKCPRYPIDEKLQDDRLSSERFTSHFHRFRWLQAPQSKEQFEGRLSLDQLDRLGGLYLRLEGMVAICRPEFSFLFDRPANQANIIDICAKYRKDIDGVHQAIFLHTDDNEVVLILAGLRQLSVDMDKEIMLSLSSLEKKRLHDFLSSSSCLDGYVHPKGGPERFAITEDQPEK